MAASGCFTRIYLLLVRENDLWVVDELGEHAEEGVQSSILLLRR
ncbi:hypothetical protein [Archaeoglobus sp.]